jgi:hypothetical protein
MINEKNSPAVEGQVERRVRQSMPEIGMWLRIKKRYDNGGFRLIRIDEIDESGAVFVSDWIDFGKPYLKTDR